MPSSRPVGAARHVVSRRRFLESGLAALAASLVARCDDYASTGTPPSPRLSARPGTPTVTPTLGLSELGIGIGTSRDGLLYVPTTYTGQTSLPLFVALHGAGGSGASWASYQARAEARGMVLLAPESRGATWDLALGSLGPDVAFLNAALRHTFDRCRIDPARIALGGFSDGASYALSLGVSNGDLFTHLVGHSPGFFDPSAPIVGRPRIYVSHGKLDGVLPVTTTRDVIVPALRDGGYDVTYKEFYGFHELPAKISDAALDWFLAIP